MPRKPRRERRLKFPGLGASFEKKLKFFSQENERQYLTRLGLLFDFEAAITKKRVKTSKKAVEMDENGLETAKIELETKNKDNE